MTSFQPRAAKPEHTMMMMTKTAPNALLVPTLTDLVKLNALLALLALFPKKEVLAVTNVNQELMKEAESSALTVMLALIMINLVLLNAKLALEVQSLLSERPLAICANLVLTLWTVWDAITVLLDNIPTRLVLPNANHALLVLLLLVEAQVVKPALEVLTKLIMFCAPSAGDSVLLAKIFDHLLYKRLFIMNYN